MNHFVIIYMCNFGNTTQRIASRYKWAEMCAFYALRSESSKNPCETRDFVMIQYVGNYIYTVLTRLIEFLKLMVLAHHASLGNKLVIESLVKLVKKLSWTTIEIHYVTGTANAIFILKHFFEIGRFLVYLNAHRMT